MNIIHSGNYNYQRTDAFRQKSDVIRNEIRGKYDEQIKSESNFLRKIILKLRMNSEIRKAVEKMSSGNLHLSSNT